MRIGGLGSGLDTDAIIGQLMAIERRPLLLMQQKQVQLEAQKNAWRDVNTRLKHLSDKFLSLKLESTYVSRMAEAGNELVFKAFAERTAVTGSYNVEVIQLATGVGQHSAKLAMGANEELGVGEGSSISIKLGGKDWTIEVAAEDTLNSLVQKINASINEAEEAVPVTASVVDNRLVLSSKETGVASRFSVGVTGEELSSLLLGPEGEFTEVAGGGQRAKVIINGIEVESDSNSLKDVIQGVTLDLQDAGKTTLTVSQDTQQVVDKLQEFVDQYNSVLDFINEKLQAQSAMDPNSKQGTLSGDTTLMRLQSSLRSIVAGGAGGDGEYRSLADIGIGTAKFVPGAADYSGKLTLDKAKLDEALKENPLAVKELLYKVTEVEQDGEMVTKDSGIFHNLETYVRDFTRAGDGILTEKDKSYDKQIKDLKEQAEKMEYRLELRQERLVSQFVALERALSTMQSQGNWLTSQIGQLNNMFSQPKK